MSGAPCSREEPLARLFFAAVPPPSVVDGLLSLMHGVEGARWQTAGQIHLTLRFVGEADRHGEALLADALANLRHPPVAARLAGAGSFERRGRLQALIARVEPLAPLKALHDKIDRLCITCGFAPEERRYLPHVTLARFGSGGGDAGAFLARHAGLASPEFAVTEAILFESALGSSGAHYEPLASVRLRA